MLSRSGETCRPSTSTSSPTLPIDRHVAPDRRPRRRRAGSARRRRRPRARRPSRGRLRAAARASTRAGVRADARAEPLEVVERVDVVDEVRRVDACATARAPRSARRCPGRRRGSNRSGDESASAFVVPSAAGDEREPAVGDGAGEREAGRARSRTARSALTTRYGADPRGATAASSPARTAAPWPPPRVGDERRVRRRRPARARRRTSARRQRRPSTTSASIACASAVRGSRGSRPRRLLPFSPAEGDDQRRHRRGPYRRRSRRRGRGLRPPSVAGRRATPTRAGRTSASRAAPRRRSGRCARG